MCGIAGFINKNKKSINIQLINNMLNSISHRGPDHTKIIDSKEFTGGYVRLSINDLKNGSQPFITKKKNNEIISFYNGEIYNYLDLKKDLIKRGYKFKTNCDGEIIPSMFDAYGDNFFEKLEGMFSICIWESKNKKLLLGRDHLGEKPLYYLHKKNEIVFSSEIKSICEYKLINKSINHQSIWDIPTFLWVPEPNTIINEIKSLPPSSYLKFLNGKFKIQKYNSKIFQKFDKNISDVSKTYNVVYKSILSRNLSDAPVGSFLSGGIDSSLVTKISLEKNRNLKTYTVAFEDLKDPYNSDSIDESFLAKKFAKKLKISNTTIYANSKNLKKEFIYLSSKIDQPMAISSALGISMVARRAKKDGVKVLLSGDGADEMFCGYDWYKYIQKILNYKNYSKQYNRDLNFQITEKKDLNFFKNLSCYKNSKLGWALHYYASEQDKLSIFSKDFSKDKKSSLRFFKSLEKKNINPIDFIKHDRNFYLNNEMLFKLDRCTMLHSIESRSPFTSSMVSNYVKNLKIETLMKNNTLKYLIKKAFKKHLPQSILNRPKHGFNVPIDHYLANQWSDLLKETFSNNSELFKLGFVDKNSYKNVKKILQDKKKMSGHTILSFISLNIWLQNNSWK